MLPNPARLYLDEHLSPRLAIQLRMKILKIVYNTVQKFIVHSFWWGTTKT